MKALYTLARPLIFRLDPEHAHDLALRALAHPATALALECLHPRVRRREVKLWNLTFRNPVGLAAGLDKNAVALRAWRALNFGFVETGTVTPRPQPGNPPPRVWRFPEHQALVNAMGFPNDGMLAIRERLAAFTRREGFPIGVNLGKNATTPLDQAADDYVAGLRALHDVGDYFVVNISSPNTRNLRELQERGALTALLGALQDARASFPERKPLLVKIAPDLSDAALDQIAEVAREMRIDGLVATNTTRDHSILALPNELPGGLSGAPLRPRALEVIRRLARATNGSLPLIGVGGVMSAADSRALLDAGASLVQVYTGFIYLGPDAVRHLVPR
jgi:dihydroorotate dehydrogenase